MAFKMKGFNPGKGTGMGSSFNKRSDDDIDDLIPPKIEEDVPINMGVLPEVKVTDKYPSKKSRKLAKKREHELELEKTLSNPVVQNIHKYTDKTTDKVYKGIDRASWLFPGGWFGKGAIKGGQLAHKLSKAQKVVPKKIPHYGKISSQKNIDDILDVTKSRGKMYDDLYTKKPWQWSSKNFTKAPSVSGREMIQLNVKGLPPQRFYKSTGWGGKSLKSGQSSKGKWVPLEGFGNRPGIQNWFIKGKGWDQGYGSKLFKDIDHYISKFAK